LITFVVASSLVLAIYSRVAALREKEPSITSPTSALHSLNWEHMLVSSYLGITLRGFHLITRSVVSSTLGGLAPASLMLLLFQFLFNLVFSLLNQVLSQFLPMLNLLPSMLYQLLLFVVFFSVLPSLLLKLLHIMEIKVLALLECLEVEPSEFNNILRLIPQDLLCEVLHDVW
jgi:hypothetical protein